MSVNGATAIPVQAGSAQSLTLAELNRRLDAEVWADLASGHGDIPAARRALQRRGQFVPRLQPARVLQTGG